MRLIVAFLSLAASVAAFWGHRINMQSPQLLQLRDLSSCEQTYGEGWAQCNGELLMACYNPSLGQVCNVLSSRYRRPNILQ